MTKFMLVEVKGRDQGVNNLKAIQIFVVPPRT